MRCESGGEDGPAGRAVVALKPDHLGAGKIVLEAQNVCRPRRRASRRSTDRRRRRSRCFWGLGAVQSLRARDHALPLPRGESWGEGLGVIVRHHAELLTRLPPPRRPLPLRGGGDERAERCAPALRQQPQPEILRHVGVLILIDQDEFEAALILPQHVELLAEQPDALKQQIAESAALRIFSRS